MPGRLTGHGLTLTQAQDDYVDGQWDKWLWDREHEGGWTQDELYAAAAGADWAGDHLGEDGLKGVRRMAGDVARDMMFESDDERTACHEGIVQWLAIVERALQEIPA
jgi:hypothetical protein